MLTKQARLTSFLSSNTSYDPDRLAFDQQKLRQYYLTEGYADFRVVSAVAELTPDKRDFIITYVVEEGERYKFGTVDVESQIRDFDDEAMTARLPMQGGDWYDAKLVEDTVEQLSELAGTFGYAFADVQPQFSRNQDTLTMDDPIGYGRLHLGPLAEALALGESVSMDTRVPLTQFGRVAGELQVTVTLERVPRKTKFTKADVSARKAARKKAAAEGNPNR